jgi:raffinose/stachyose/melibiose transport system substrate-binding protein
MRTPLERRGERAWAETAGWDAVRKRQQAAERQATRGRRVRNALGLAILAGAFVWAATHVASRVLAPTESPLLEGAEVPVVRFCHWQLEGRNVQALHEACRLYEKVQQSEFGRRVRVEQLEIPERAYEQWVRTQLIGRTAPDLIEMLGTPWDNLVVRYFVPITDRVDKPNPYNSRALDRRLAAALGQGPESDAREGALEGVPWRETYVDGMEGGWRVNLQDYYGMPLSVFTIRAFANRNLLAEALRWRWEAKAGAPPGGAAGDAADAPDFETFARPYLPPRDLGSFFDLARTIEEFAAARGRKLVPIAGSRYTEKMFRAKYWSMATYSLVDGADANHDGLLTDAERLRAVFTGQVDYRTNAPIAAGHEVLFEITRHFNPGFMAAQRDQAVFLFAQGYAAMIATGTWDAGSIYEQVGGDFDILAFDYPVPAPGQKYSDVFRHRVSEAGETAGFPFGLTKFSRHPDLAIDFMHFLTSRRVNEWLNLKFRWFPANREARTDRMLEAFRPKLDGVTGGIWQMHIGGDTERLYLNRYEAYIGRTRPRGLAYDAFVQEAYEKFIEGYAADYAAKAPSDFVSKWRDGYSGVVQTEVSLADIRGRMLRAGPGDALRTNYVSLMLGQARRIESHAIDWLEFQEALAARPREVQARKGAGP